jgi:hypothetical protein
MSSLRELEKMAAAAMRSSMKGSKVKPVGVSTDYIGLLIIYNKNRGNNKIGKL